MVKQPESGNRVRDEVEIVMDSEEGFAPELTVFMCSFCGYTAADSAGALHEAYPANVKLVRLPCAGKADIRYVLEAFEQGADGVCIVACPIGNCHHVDGNVRAQARVGRIKSMLDEIGLGADRFELFFLTAAMGESFAGLMNQMSDRVKAVGPNPLG